MLLASALTRFIRIGRLVVIDATGRRHVFAGSPGPSVTIRLHDPVAATGSCCCGLASIVPEAYVDGRLTIEEGSLYDLIDLLVLNDAARVDSAADAARRGRRPAGARRSPVQPGARARAATSRITTICRTSSTICSSTATGNIPAPISARRTTISTPRSRTRSGTSRPSCCCGPGKRCSISARAGAGSRCISPPNAVPTSPG